MPRLFDTCPERGLRITFKVLHRTPGSCLVTTPAVKVHFPSGILPTVKSLPAASVARENTWSYLVLARVAFM